MKERLQTQSCSFIERVRRKCLSDVWCTHIHMFEAFQC